MKINLNWLAAIAVPFFIIWLCFFKMISPGYVGITINLFGDERGPNQRELKVGMHWIAPWKKVYKFPVFEQNHIWEHNKSFTFQTGEGLNVNADIGVSYHLNEGSVYKLFCKYRRGIDEITDIFIRNYTRDAINKISSKMKIEDLYGSEKSSFIENVQAVVRKDLIDEGIVIDRIYLIGTLHFPTLVVNALNAKIEATQIAQKRENELREASAKAAKKVAEAEGTSKSILIRAKAEADANLLVSKSITPELIRYELTKKWNGELPKVISDITPFINLDLKDKK